MRKLVLFVLLVTAGVAQAGDHYYMWIFGYQGRGAFNLPRFTHSFALFTRVTELNEVEAATISWLPQDGIVGALEPPKRGENYSLSRTFGIIQNKSYDWRKFGPYEIQGELFDRAKRREQELNRGQILYHMLANGRPYYSTNCIHAISDLDRGRGALETGNLRGIGASAELVRHLRRWMVGGTPKDDVTRAVTEKLRLPLWYLK